MSNKCWYNLKIDISNCFLEGYKLPEPVGKYGIWHPLAKDVFNPQWLRYTRSIGLPIYSVMIFYRGPYAHTAQAHVDVGKAEPFCLTNFGINWCYGGEGSEMAWYETPIEPKPVSYTEAKTPYMSWDADKLKEIERTHIGNEVSIVRTGIPHSIKMDKDPRWAISARCSLLDNYNWETVIEELRKKNLLIER